MCVCVTVRAREGVCVRACVCACVYVEVIINTSNEELYKVFLFIKPAEFHCCLGSVHIVLSTLLFVVVCF